MATRKPTGARNETIKCENCGEYYSVTYKRCPFCDEKTARRAPRGREQYEEAYEEDYDEEYEDDEFEDQPRRERGGGKRLATNTRGGGYGGGPSPWKIVGTVLSVALIIAAVYIVFTIVRPLIDKGKPVDPPVSPSPAVTGQVTPTPAVTPTPGLTPPVTGQPGDGDTPVVVPSAQPTPDMSVIPSGQTATGFSLVDGAGSVKQDITLSDQYPDFTFKVSFTPSGSTGAVAWASSNAGVVAVDQNGKVTPVSKGVATITATMAGGYSQSCIVRNQVSGGSSGAVSPEAPGQNGGEAVVTTPAATPTPTPAQNASGIKLNVFYDSGAGRYDFTLKENDSWKLKVTGASGAPTYSIKDASIATVSEDGTVSAVSKGETTLTVTVDGQTLTCIVRCSW